MKKCPVCGAKMPDIARFCGYCGHPLGGEEIFSTALPKVEKNVELPPPPKMPTGEAIGATTEGLLPEDASLVPEGEGLIPEETTEGLVETGAGKTTPTEAHPATAQTEVQQPAEAPTETKMAEQPLEVKQPALQAQMVDPFDEILAPENIEVPENETVKGAMQKLIEFVQQPRTPEEIIKQLRYTRAVIMKRVPYNPLYQELLEWINAFKQFPPGVVIDEQNHRLLVNAVTLWADRVEDVPGVPG